MRGEHRVGLLCPDAITSKEILKCLAKSDGGWGGESSVTGEGAKGDAELKCIALAGGGVAIP